LSKQRLDHVFSQIVRGLLVDIVRNDEPVSTVSSLLASNVANKVVLGLLNQIGIVQEIVLGVEIEVNNVVAEVLQICLTVGIAARERWAHVSWEDTQDVVQGDLVVVHLVFPLGRSDGSQVLMSPGVARNLMAGSVHALDDSRIA
jgi:hypothetical protein